MACFTSHEHESDSALTAHRGVAALRHGYLLISTMAMSRLYLYIQHARSTIISESLVVVCTRRAPGCREVDINQATSQTETETNQENNMQILELPIAGALNTKCYI